MTRRRALAVRALRARRRRLPRPGRRALLGARPLPRALPARHPDGDGGDGRDARDLPYLDPARRAARAVGAAIARRSTARARRASSSATSRTPTPTAPRSTSPSSRAPAAAPRSSSGRRSSAAPARRSSPTARRSPTITRSAATTPRTWRPRWGDRPRGAARGQGAARPGRDHEPRQAAPLAALRASLASSRGDTDDRAGDRRRARTSFAGVGGRSFSLLAPRRRCGFERRLGPGDVDLVEGAVGQVGEEFGRHFELGGDPPALRDRGRGRAAALSAATGQPDV